MVFKSISGSPELAYYCGRFFSRLLEMGRGSLGFMGCCFQEKNSWDYVALPEYGWFITGTSIRFLTKTIGE